MTKLTINNYDDLLAEKQRLEAILAVQKDVLRKDVKEIKEQMQPAIGAVKFISKLTTKDTSNSLLNLGADTMINTLLNKFALGRAGFLTRIILPYITKNFSSHYIADNKDKWLHKFANWLRSKKTKEQDDTETATL